MGRQRPAHERAPVAHAPAVGVHYSGGLGRVDRAPAADGDEQLGLGALDGRQALPGLDVARVGADRVEDRVLDLGVTQRLLDRLGETGGAHTPVGNQQRTAIALLRCARADFGGTAPAVDRLGGHFETRHAWLLAANDTTAGRRPHGTAY